MPGNRLVSIPRRLLGGCNEHGHAERLRGNDPGGAAESLGKGGQAGPLDSSPKGSVLPGSDVGKVSHAKLEGMINKYQGLFGGIWHEFTKGAI